MCRIQFFKLVFTIATVLLGTLICTQHVTADEDKYTWCKADEEQYPSQNRVFYSDAFPEDEHKTQVDYMKAFGDYVTSHYGVQNQPTCHWEYGRRSKSEANADRDSDASRSRGNRQNVIFTHWTY